MSGSRYAVRMSRDDCALVVGLVVAAVAFLALAPSEGATTGGGILVLVSLPVGVAIYLALRPPGPAVRRRQSPTQRVVTGRPATRPPAGPVQRLKKTWNSNSPSLSTDRTAAPVGGSMP